MAPKTKFQIQCEETMAKLPALMAQVDLQIRTRNEGRVSIVPNQVQRHYHDKRVAAGFSAHDIILKSRQHGFTTWKLLEALIMAMFVPNFGAALVAQEAETSARIFRTLRFAYDHLDDAIKAELPLKEDRRGSGIEFMNGSYVNVYTAGARSGAGRGLTHHSIHFTEVSSYIEANETITGITESAANWAHISMESTARGRGNLFHEIWEGAVAGTNSYHPHFYAWWWAQDNMLELDPHEKVEPYTDEELDIIAAAAADGFTLLPEHIKWRRWKRADSGDLFYQEQAEDPDTCFLMSGNPLFDAPTLRRLVQHCQSALILEQSQAPGGGSRVVWKRPNKTFPYIVAVDVSEGLPHGDWSIISTWQYTHDAMIQVAKTKMKCSTDDLAVAVVQEAQQYHNALVAIERNGLGASVVQKVEDLGYVNQYQALSVDGDITDRLGWFTNRNNKKIGLEELAAGAYAGDIISYDRELWTEAENITRDDMGRPQTPKKKHDDHVMAAMIANMAKDQAVLNSSGSFVTSLLG